MGHNNPRLDSNPVHGTHWLIRQEPLIEIFVDTSTTLGADAHARKSSKKRRNQIIEYNFGSLLPIRFQRKPVSFIFEAIHTFKSLLYDVTVKFL